MNPLRILVTGSRGKSSVVRLLHAGLRGAGIEAWARITGVVPRQLGPDGVRDISRSSGAHVGEMRWWLRRLPASADAVVLENSAITQDLQGLAARWLRPDLVILASVVPDHQEAWGHHPAGAVEALVAGIPRGRDVLIPDGLLENGTLRRLLEQRRCRIACAKPADVDGPLHQAVNTGLALEALERLGVPTQSAWPAMQSLPPDRYDYRVTRHGGAAWALAFSVNDLESTRQLFRALDWPPETTRLVYNHRADRPGRFRSFRGWMSRGRWREVLIIGDRPVFKPANARFVKLKDAASLLSLVRPGERIFGCGNIAGHPLALY